MIVAPVSEKGMIGIVVAAYNAEDTIADTIYSIRNQTDPNYLCVVVDDGSSDRTQVIVQDAIKEDKRFVLIFQKNAGPAEARNRAVRELSTKFFFYVDADDTIEPSFIERMKQNMTKYPGYNVYSANAVMENAEGSSIFYQMNKPKEISFEEICESCCIVGGGTIIEKKIFDELNGFKKQCHAEDYDFWIRFFARHYKAIVFPEVLYHYNLDMDSASRSQDWEAGIYSVHNSFLNILETEELSEVEKGFVKDSAENILSLLRTADMYKVMGRQKEKIRNSISKVFGSEVADGLIEILSSFGPLVRKFRVWSALKKVDENNRE